MPSDLSVASLTAALQERMQGTQEEPKLEQRIPPEGLAGSSLGELEMQVFAPGMASNTAPGLEAGAVIPSG